MLDLIWSPAALDDLEDITSYVAQFNESAAFALRIRIEQSVDPARRHPQMFRSGRVEQTREIVAHPNYIVVYRIFPEYIEVVAVVHSRQEYP